MQAFILGSYGAFAICMPFPLLSTSFTLLRTVKDMTTICSDEERIGIGVRSHPPSVSVRTRRGVEGVRAVETPTRLDRKGLLFVAGAMRSEAWGTNEAKAKNNLRHIETARIRNRRRRTYAR
jgi:hypothetical protein